MMSINKKPARSDKLKRCTSMAMKTILNTCQNKPGIPFCIDEIKAANRLTRNDMISARRQLKKINYEKGALRYVCPAETHVIFVEDSLTERMIQSLLAAAAAFIQMKSNNPSFATSNVERIGQYIYQMNK